MRRANLHRKTKETDIELSLLVDGRGRYEVSTGIRFFDHMLELFAHHGGFDLVIKPRRSRRRSAPHRGRCWHRVWARPSTRRSATKRGILRAGYFLMPMDETLGLAAVDFSGRTASVDRHQSQTRLVGDLQSELVVDFFEAFAAALAPMSTLAFSTADPVITRSNLFSRRLPAPCAAACWRDHEWLRLLPSTKGVL